MQKNCVVLMVLALLCVGTLALAQDQPQPLYNWTAPPYWTPLAGRQVHEPLGTAFCQNVPVKADVVALTPLSYPFTAVPPCRLVDTFHNATLDIPTYSSTESGPPYGGGDFAAGETRTYDLTASTASCNGLPKNIGIVAWSLNFQYTTMHNPPPYDEPSSLTAWASTSSKPSPGSTMLGYPDRWLANSAIIEAGTDANGSIDVYTQFGGSVIIEVNGYYAPHFEYGYIYNLTTQAVAVEAAVTFDTNGPLVGFSHTSGTAGITVLHAGMYEITFSLSGVEPNQFALFVNGTAAPSSVYGSGAGTQQNNGQVILALAAGDVVTIVNHSSAAAVTLQTLAGGTQTNVSASVLIRKLD